MRLGVFGGSFNPPHHAHVICAQEARMQLKLDEVVLVPAGRPPHREISARTFPTADQRLSLTRLAALGQPGLSVASIEVDRDGTSYTVDTLAELTESRPDAQLTLIIGTDQAVAFGNWREPVSIGALAEIAAAARSGHDIDAARAAVTAATGRPTGSFEMPQIDISSTMIRERIARGDTVAHFTPAGVPEMIEEAGLYR